jgi:hypothetical protein
MKEALHCSLNKIVVQVTRVARHITTTEPTGCLFQDPGVPQAFVTLPPSPTERKEGPPVPSHLVQPGVLRLVVGLIRRARGKADPFC